jgi:hypothetical protein
MTTLLAIWAFLALICMMVGQGPGSRSAGLPLAFFIELSLIHVPGAFVYANNPKWQPAYVLTYGGFRQTVVGMAAFMLAVLLARKSANHVPEVSRRNPFHHCSGIPKNVPQIYMGLGLASFILAPVISRIPSGGAIASALTSLLIVGLALRLWETRQSGNSNRYWQTVALIPLLPLITLLKDGFMSFGTNWLICTGAFFFNQARAGRLIYILAMPFVGVLGLAVFVNYMASRTEYRQLVWYQNVGMAQRLDQVVKMGERFEWLDFSSERQRLAIDERLNQNLLVGMAVDRLDRGVVDFAWGSTLSDMARALIPRAIWPNKPAVGGGGDVVARFSGYVAEPGTSVGAGNVLEFYANFGVWGVIAGFFLCGWLIARVDLAAITHLSQGNDAGFLAWFLPGLAMIQPGGNLLETAASVASAVLAAKGLGWIRRHSTWLTGRSTPRAHANRKLGTQGTTLLAQAKAVRLPGIDRPPT